MSSAPPRAFLLPSIFGDGPPLEKFRAALAGRMAFDLVDYPDIERPSSEIRNFDRILEQTVRRVRSLQPSGEVNILGYSFGGLVGFAAACQLQEEGRRVGLLALLDSRVLSLKVPKLRSAHAQPRCSTGRLGRRRRRREQVADRCRPFRSCPCFHRPHRPDFGGGSGQWPSPPVPPESPRACPHGTEPWAFRRSAPSFPGARATLSQPADRTSAGAPTARQSAP